jgi:hypothetical protein
VAGSFITKSSTPDGGRLAMHEKVRTETARSGPQSHIYSGLDFYLLVKFMVISLNLQISSILFE